jgi:hypothetical protein
MLNNFKWYRKLRGGTWYLMEYKYRDVQWFDHVETRWFRNALTFEKGQYSAYKILTRENYEN